MTNGVTALEKTLIGVEALSGSTTDVPTTHWRGTGKIKNRREWVYPPERVGKVGGTTRKYSPKTGGEVLLEGDATFEQLPYIFNSGIYATTPTTDSGSGQVWQWTVQHSATDPLASTDVNSLVVESGDNNAFKISRYCFTREYTLSGRQGEGLQISATLQSRAPSTGGTFTAVGDTDLQNPAETILFSMVSMWIDASTDTMGTTQKTETILDMSLKHTTGWVALAARDGRLDFSSIKHIDDEIMLDVTYEHNGVADAEYSAFEAGTERAIRLQFAGTALTSAGTYTTKLFRLDLVGTWSTFGAEGLEEQDGDNVYRGTFRVAYSALAAAKAVFTVVNELSALP